MSPWSSMKDLLIKGFLQCSKVLLLFLHQADAYYGLYGIFSVKTSLWELGINSTLLHCLCYFHLGPIYSFITKGLCELCGRLLFCFRHSCVSSKGQLISKSLLGCLQNYQNTNEVLKDFCPSLQRSYQKSNSTLFH